MSKSTNILLGFHSSASDRGWSQRHSTFHFYTQVTPKVLVSSSEGTPPGSRCSAVAPTTAASTGRLQNSLSPQYNALFVVDTRCVSTAAQYFFAAL